MGNVRIGGLGNTDYVLIETYTCPTCGAEIRLYATAGEPVPSGFLEKYVYSKIASVCPHHGGCVFVPY